MLKFMHLFRKKGKENQNSEKALKKRKEEECGFDANALVLVFTLLRDYRDFSGVLHRRVDAWEFGRVLKSVSYVKRRASSIEVEVELLFLSDPLSVLAQDNDLEEWQANDSGMVPLYENNSTLQAHRVLGRLDSMNPLGRYVWERGPTTTVTVDHVIRATRANFLVLTDQRSPVRI